MVPSSVWAVDMNDYCCSFESLTKEIVCSLYMKAFFFRMDPCLRNLCWLNIAAL
jgi:hypothetical protein